MHMGHGSPPLPAASPSPLVGADDAERMRPPLVMVSVNAVLVQTSGSARFSSRGAVAVEGQAMAAEAGRGGHVHGGSGWRC